jgi:tetratricopeptide (TPR) repeat protein
VVGVRGPGGGDVPLFGREREMDELGAALDAVADDGRAQAVLLLGPAGIGKSRLRHELLRRVVEREMPVLWLEGHGEAHRALKGWHVIESALRQVLELPEGSAAEEVREALVTFCPEEECAWFVGEILSAHFPAVSGLVTARSNPSVMRDRVVIALGDLLESLCRRQPVALVIDDAQWSDRPSLELVDTLLERLAGMPFFALACARTEPTSALAAFRRLELGGLDRAASRALAQAVSEGHSFDDATLEGIHDRSGGNPYFVEELSRARREGREQMPTSVEAAVQARLDALPRPSKDLLRRASVLGRRFWAECLVAMGEPEPAAILAALSRDDFVTPERRSRLANTTEWSFRSKLVEQTAYESLTPAQRTGLHQAAAQWLGSRPDGEAAEIARHLELAEDPGGATPYWLRATDRALQSGDTPLAIEASSRVLSRPLDRETAFRLRARRTDLFGLTGRWREEEDELERLVEVAVSPDERAFLFEARGRRLRNRSLFADAQAAIEAGLAIAPKRAPLLVEGALIRALAGSPEQGLVQTAEAIQAALATDDRITMARALACAAHCHATLGDFGAARPMLVEALEAFRTLGDPARAITLELNLGYNELMLGLHEEAVTRLEGSLSRARATGNRSAQGWALHNLGLALARSGHIEEGLDAEAAALAIGHASREPRLVRSSLKYAAAILLEAGRPEEALERVAQAADGPDALPDTTLAELETLRAVALLELGREAEGRRHVERALGLHARVGGLDAFESELFLAAEDAGLAGSLARGLELLVARASRIADPLLRKSYLERVPANARLVERSRR